MSLRPALPPQPKRIGALSPRQLQRARLSPIVPPRFSTPEKTRAIQLHPEEHTASPSISDCERSDSTAVTELLPLQEHRLRRPWTAEEDFDELPARASETATCRSAGLDSVSSVSEDEQTVTRLPCRSASSGSGGDDPLPLLLANGKAKPPSPKPVTVIGLYIPPCVPAQRSADDSGQALPVVRPQRSSSHRPMHRRHDTGCHHRRLSGEKLPEEYKNFPHACTGVRRWYERALRSPHDYCVQNGDALWALKEAKRIAEEARHKAEKAWHERLWVSVVLPSGRLFVSADSVEELQRRAQLRLGGRFTALISPHGDVLKSGIASIDTVSANKGVPFSCLADSLAASTERAFAVVRRDGSCVCWGDPDFGGDPRNVRWKLARDVRQVFSTTKAFAILKGDGSVATWGDRNGGGDSKCVRKQLASDVHHVFSAGEAFAALKADGSVVSWGSADAGGDSQKVQEQLQKDVQHVYSTEAAFAALRSDGSVVTWGDARHGGDSSAVHKQLCADVQHIYSNSCAFAALKRDRSIVTWGDARMGGDSGSVHKQIASGVQHVYSTAGAFAALKGDGAVATWGVRDYGGKSGKVSAQLTTDVQDIYSTAGAFAAVKSDSVVTWGDPRRGGDSTSVHVQLAHCIA
eukprot:gnl/TRDRNA2_/TRDRNA2_161876_c0_seq2.p1 gnl/TRDRNA2_/TRDRNA2_161876_c0~~gnl/TRDRNA2_/TRDRNA2_161876_c0_seq2.p1  ORF type:complete len:634 (+),score=107.86 gnl/TRDRNA2_/TRDRNA2_161876_c0_seq2:67-1968(+)